MDLLALIAAALMNAGCILLLLLAFMVIKRIVEVINEATLLYKVAFGHKTHCETVPSKRLMPFTVPIKILAEEDFQEIYRFVQAFVDGEYSIDDQIKILRKFDYICIFRDRVSGHIMGTLTYAMESRERKGNKYTVLKSGMAFFNRSCTGSPMFMLCVLLPCLWQFLKHPSRPIYLMTWTFSYMSYLYTVKNSGSTYPRHDCSKVPEFEQSLLDEFGHSLSTEYNSKTFVAPRVNCGKLKTNLATVPDYKLSDPHVKFFVENNPGYAEGSGMVVCSKLTWKVFIESAKSLLSRALNPPKDRSGGQMKRSRKVFVTETEYLKENGFMAKKLLDELRSPPPKERSKKSTKHVPLETPKSFLNSQSILMGVDRIDEYSRVDIPL